MRKVYVVVTAALLATSVWSPVSGQHDESLDTTPRWPSRYRGGIIVPGEVAAVDPEQGTATVKTDTGEIATGVASSAVPDVKPGDRVDLQLVPSGRSPSAVGGAASDPGLVGRILPPLPPVQPGAGLQEAP